MGGNTPRDTGRTPTLQVSSKEVVVEGPLKLRHIAVPEVEASKLKELLEQKERESFVKKRGLNEGLVSLLFGAFLMSWGY